MELSIPSTSASVDRRGSYSSAKSTLAAGIWTPPHSPTVADMHMEAEEELPTPTTSTRPEDKAVHHEEAQLQHQLAGVEVVNTVDNTSEAVVEAEQPAELRLSDFQVVDTLGQSPTFVCVDINSKQLLSQELEPLDESFSFASDHSPHSSNSTSTLP